MEPSLIPVPPAPVALVLLVPLSDGEEKPILCFFCPLKMYPCWARQQARPSVGYFQRL